MKIAHTLVLFLCTLGIAAQSNVYISSPITVPPNNTYGYRAPRILLNADQQPVIYWGKPNTSTLYISYMVADTFTQPMALQTGGVDPDLFGGGLGPQLANNGDTLFIVFEEYGAGIYSMRSTDGGHSFEAPVTVYDPPTGRVATLPSVSVDPLGNPIVSFVTTNNNEAEALYEVAKSTDQGLSFQPAVVANTPAAGDEVCECCPANLSLNSMTDYLLVFRNNNSNIRDIWAARSTDGGLNFDQATDVDDTDWETFTCPQSGPMAYQNGDSLYIAYYSGANADFSVYLSTLHIPTMQKGRQLDLPRAINSNANQNFPRIAGSGDTLGIIWQENSVGVNDLSFSWSTNGSADLAKQVIRVDSAAGVQRFADIQYADGIFHIVYEDVPTTNVIYRQISFEPITSNREVLKNPLAAQLRPNPAANQTTVYFDNPKQELVRLAIYNSMGQLLSTQSTTNTQQSINTGDFVPGIYSIRLQLGTQLGSLKFIVR